MYLFARTARLTGGRFQASMGWATEITEKVNQISELEFRLWTPVMSPRLGTLVWTTTCDSLADLESTDAKLMTDSRFLTLLEEGITFMDGNGVDDAIVNVVHADGMGEGETSNYASVVRAIAAPGNQGRAVLLGVEIAQMARAITGRPTSFGTASTGPYGGVQWVTMFDTIDQVQAAEMALAMDAGFTAMLDTEASTAYLSPAATQAIYRRTA